MIFSAITFVAPASAKPKVHTVYEGQRLGSIAKRYNVTVEELCKANGISARDPIKPGQKLVIPGTDDGTGAASESAPPKPAGPATVHVVASGHTLGAISNRYAVTVNAIENANGIKRTTPLKVGQKLVIPHKTDTDGAYARKQRLRGHFDEKEEKADADSKSDKSGGAGAKSGEATWKKYEKAAWRRGYIKIRRYDRFWEGYVIGPKNEVLGHASNKINFVMGARQDGPRIDPELIRLIASVSDKFGGREMRIVSGYRTKSFVAASKHKQGKAIDFSIPGIPNEALRDYLRTIKGVGVGYYPNSSFVHLDVRGYNSYWVDFAGPGQAPRKTQATAKKNTSKGAPAEDSDEEEYGPTDDDAGNETDDSDAVTEESPPPKEKSDEEPAKKPESKAAKTKG